MTQKRVYSFFTSRLLRSIRVYNLRYIVFPCDPDTEDPLKREHPVHGSHVIYTSSPSDDQQMMLKRSMELYNVPILLETENSAKITETSTFVSAENLSLVQKTFVKKKVFFCTKPGKACM